MGVQYDLYTQNITVKGVFYSLAVFTHNSSSWLLSFVINGRDMNMNDKTVPFSSPRPLPPSLPLSLRADILFLHHFTGANVLGCGIHSDRENTSLLS